MKIYIGVILIFFGFSSANGQKTLEKEWDVTEIHRLEITTKDVYEIYIKSEPRNSIAIRLKMEGETSESMMLKELESNGILLLETAHNPFFKPYNDKLAAHKVLAMELEIVVPEHIEIAIQGTIASVIGEGSYQSLSLLLQNGYCNLQNFAGNAQIETKKGGINVSAKKGVTAFANSKYGKVTNELTKSGNYSIQAQSDFGDIELTRSQ